MSVSEEQRAQIIALLEQPLSSDEIAERVGVGKMVVAGYRAALARKAHEQTDDAVSATMDAVETTFGLERDLQVVLRQNIGQLEHGLRITDDGKEQAVESGRIDITAEDKHGTPVVIELKAGTADRKSVAQILVYIGDLMQTKKSVRGILVAGNFPPRTIAAARAVPNLALKRYNVKFTFEAVGSEKR